MTAAERYHRMKAAGLCVDCRQTADGRSRCELCRIRHDLEECRRARARTRTRQAERYARQLERIEHMLELARQLDDLARQQKVKA